jgi:cytochrome c peroxidase
VTASRRRAAGSALALAAALTACSSRKPDRQPEQAPAAHPPVAATTAQPPADVVLPPPPPVPPLPTGLPAPPQQAAITAEAVALGAVLFHDRRLSVGGAVSCASCHAEATGYAGGRTATALGRPNLRSAPPLVNAAWQRELGWDGFFDDLASHLAAHLHGQLGAAPDDAIAALADDATVRAHFRRAFARAPSGGDAIAALAAFVRTRYAGDARWDRVERGASDPLAVELKAGYALFTGKAQCSVCHPPPLYTDLAYHRLGLIASADEGRGRVAAAQRGAFKTPTLRDAALRTSFFHDGSATTLAQAVQWHLDGGVGQGAAPSIVDPALSPVALDARERAQLLAFVAALSRDPAPTSAPPAPARASPPSAAGSR